MATTVLIRLSGPLQSYGASSHWTERETGPRPTKSAVAGLIANALGRDWSADLSDLRTMTFAVRADRPGHLLTDDQTAGGGTFPSYAFETSAPGGDIPHYGVPRIPARRPDGTVHAPWAGKDRTPVQFRKHYLADAAFLAGLTTDDHHLAEHIIQALRQPSGLLYLGRRCCPPSHPPAHGTTPHGAETWPDRIPLLPQATTTRPRTWTETTPRPGAAPSPEQVPTTYLERDHPLMFLLSATATPPPTEEP
ncbi:type I-E CRISPR-associated protein Cas5/CasD [Streptomyces sp. CA-111067]|uniref:type I-E CRISPR-associated protein Cas5/CasD n=1 Tax=Streptomyces sp. CA-111067 TaxID=3240046 RepID=UPI003D9994F2